MVVGTHKLQIKEVYMEEMNKKLEEAYIVIALLQAKLAEKKE